MKISGHGLRDHFRLLAPLLGLLTGVWVLRLILGAAGAPQWLTGLFSMTAVAPLSVFFAVFLIHVRRFGNYPNVVVASLILNTWSQLLIIAAILFSVLTGTENIYTIPEYSIPGDDPDHRRHIYGHLTIGIGISTLTGAALGCLLLWLLRKMVPAPPQPAPDQ
jgi:hypothetical protein